ncbi:hypothetical protein MRX96_046476 [Rhipicephalus microplus]
MTSSDTRRWRGTRALPFPPPVAGGGWSAAARARLRAPVERAVTNNLGKRCGTGEGSATEAGVWERRMAAPELPEGLVPMATGGGQFGTPPVFSLPARPGKRRWSSTPVQQSTTCWMGSASSSHARDKGRQPTREEENERALIHSIGRGSAIDVNDEGEGM